MVRQNTSSETHTFTQSTLQQCDSINYQPGVWRFLGVSSYTNFNTQRVFIPFTTDMLNQAAGSTAFSGDVNYMELSYQSNFLQVSVIPS